MHIVILDGYTTNPGDLSWDSLRRLGKVTVYDHTEKQEIVTRAKDAGVIVMCRTPMPEEILKKLPKLRLITTLATGHNTIDIEAAKKQGVAVCNVPSYCTASVSQSVFALLLELCCHTAAYTSEVRTGNWEAAVRESHRKYSLFELAGKTFGVLGLGDIGETVARIARAFGMRVRYYSRSRKDQAPFEYTDLDTLLRESDVLSLHCPLTDETRGIIGEEELAKMKPTALLINTARGALIDEHALSDALNTGRLAGAGLDVLTDEPPKPDCPLLSAKNCVITPHVSWASAPARTRLIDEVAKNIASFLGGKTKNQVNT